MVLINRLKKNTENIYSYQGYDISKIKHEIPFTIDTSKPLDPSELIPDNLDRCVLGKRYSVKSLFTTVMTQISRYSKIRSLHPSKDLVQLKAKLSDAFQRRYLKPGFNKLTVQTLL